MRNRRDAARPRAGRHGEGVTKRDIIAVEPLIVVVRHQRVILGSDLARIYGVEPRALTQAVKRNARRFPRDFAFQLTRREAVHAARSRSQNVILKRGMNIKYLPVAFTEHGAIMAASVLNSTRAVQMSVFVVRAFLKLREWAGEQSAFAKRLGDLEERVGVHDHELAMIIRAFRRLVIAPPPIRRRIGFAAPTTPSRNCRRLD